MSADTPLIAAFSEEQVQRLTGVSRGQLRYWSRDPHLFLPSLGQRIYSFRDIAALRVLNVLRNQYSVSLQHLRKVSERLSHLADSRWTGMRLYVLGGKVVFHEPGTALPQEVVSRQYVLPTIPLEVVVADTKRDIAAMNARTEEKVGKVVQSRGVIHNAAVIAGTRIKVVSIKRFYEAGYSVDQILKEYPDLNAEDVIAAIEYGGTKAAA